MIKVIFAFVVLYIITHAGIEVFRSMSGKEKWDFAKTVSYSVALSLFVIVMLTLIVFVF